MALAFVTDALECDAKLIMYQMDNAEHFSALTLMDAAELLSSIAIKLNSSAFDTEPLFSEENLTKLEAIAEALRVLSEDNPDTE